MSRDDLAVNTGIRNPGDLGTKYKGRGDPRELHGKPDESNLHRRADGGRIEREVQIVDEIKLG